MPDQQRKNPYFILGVDYGSSVGAATAAFGRASRRLRSSQGQHEYALEDLTWALNQVERAARGDKSVQSEDYFQVPADTEAYEPRPADGLMMIPVLPLPRATPRFPARQILQMREKLVEQATESLLHKAAAQAKSTVTSVNLAVPVSIPHSTPSLSDRVQAHHEQAAEALATEAAVSQDPRRLSLIISQATATRFGLSQRLLCALAGNPASPPGLLNRIASMPDAGREVRVAVAGNPAAPRQLLEKLLAGRDHRVFTAIAENRGAPRRLRREARLKLVSKQ